MNAMRTVVFLLSLSMAPLAGAQVQTYRISGTVVNGLTNSPLGQVTVGLARMENRRTPIFVTTQADGRFVFEKLVAGKYSLTATRRNYVPQTYGQPSTMSLPGVAIVAAPGEVTENLMFRLHPPAMISGTVTAAGEPVANAYVQVMVVSTAGGQRKLRVVAGGFTHADGTYAVGRLAAGTFYVGVSAQPWFESEARSGGLRIAWPTTFHPGVSNPAGAVPIPLRPGVEAAVNINLTPQPASLVTMAVKQTQPSFLALSTEGPDGARLYLPSTRPPYLFLLPSGRYQASYYVPGSSSPQEHVFEVTGSDETIEITPAPPATVEASLTITGPDQPPLASLSLSLFKENGATPPRLFSNEGKLEIPNVAEGKYRVAFYSQVRPTTFLEKMTAEGGRYEGGYLTVAPGAKVQLQVAVNTQGGSVEGKVTRGGRPAQGVQVILARKKPLGDFEDFKLFGTDSDGSFEFRPVAPGEYLVFAAGGEELIEYTNASVVAPYLLSALPVKVKPGDRSDIVLEMPEPAAQP